MGRAMGSTLAEAGSHNNERQRTTNWATTAVNGRNAMKEYNAELQRSADSWKLQVRSAPKEPGFLASQRQVFCCITNTPSSN